MRKMQGNRRTGKPPDVVGQGSTLKVHRADLQNVAASLVVLVMLLSGSAYAYSTRGLTSGNAQNAPSPLADQPKTSSTSSSTSGANPSPHDAVTTTTDTASTTTSTSGGHDPSTSTSTSTHTETETHDSSSTHTEAQETTQQETDEGDNSGESSTTPLIFHLVPVGSTQATGHAEVLIRGTTVNVHLEIEHADSSAMFTVVLIHTLTAATTSSDTTTASTTSSTTTSSSGVCDGAGIGSLIASSHGNGEAELSTNLDPGTYAFGIVVCSGNAPTLVGDPSTITATLTQSTGEEGKSSESQSQTATHTGTETSSTHTEHTGEETHTVSAHTTEEHDEDTIKSAEDTKTIPAVVSFSNAGVSLTQVDPQFSVAVSPLSSNGLLISISAINVTGSRVLLVNLTGSQWTPSSIQGLTVNLDGSPISEAASISQVLNSTPADPGRYIVLVTSAGLQLLVSIPHFSLHTIQILPAVSSALTFILVNGPIFLTGLIIFTGLSAALYSRRRKFFALLAYGERA